MLTVAGESLQVGPVELSLNGAEQAVTIQRLTVARKGGGTVDITGSARLNGPLALDIAVAAVPLAGLPGVAEAGIGLSGTASAQLHVAGTQNRPEISGTVKLGAVKARGVRLGDGTIELLPGDVGSAPPPVVAVSAKGSLFDRFTIFQLALRERPVIIPGPMHEQDARRWDSAVDH